MEDLSPGEIMVQILIKLNSLSLLSVWSRGYEFIFPLRLTDM